MDLEEIRQKKDALERDLGALLHEFETSTDTHVTIMSCGDEYDYTEKGVRPLVKLKVRLD